MEISDERTRVLLQQLDAVETELSKILVQLDSVSVETPTEDVADLLRLQSALQLRHQAGLSELSGTALRVERSTAAMLMRTPKQCPSESSMD